MALAFASTSTLAFQQQGSGSSAEAPAAAVAPSETPAAPEAGFAAGKPASAGTEVRIPGLGKLGVLPKMDFGLELLYGASEAKPAEENEPGQPDDLTVRGTVKHNF